MNPLTTLKIFAVSCDANRTFFGLPVWYKYLKIEDDGFGGCKFTSFYNAGGGFNTNALFLIGLGIVDMLLRIAGMVAVGFVIYGGFQYITSQGEPERTKSAKDTILNAVIGLVIVLIAIPVVSFIGKRF